MHAARLLTKLAQATTLILLYSSSALSASAASNLYGPDRSLPAALQVDQHGQRQQDGESTLSTVTRTHTHTQSPTLVVPPSEPHLHLPHPTASDTNILLDLRGLGQRGDTPAAPPAPGITQAPSPGQNGIDSPVAAGDGIITGVGPDGKPFRFRQTTYYSCVTQGATYTHCGWHMPILEAGAGRIGRAGGSMGIAARAGVAAGLVAVILGR